MVSPPGVKVTLIKLLLTVDPAIDVSFDEMVRKLGAETKD
jgi:hypothetical protein